MESVSVNDSFASITTRRSQFRRDAERHMALRAPREYALMGEFSAQSQAFVGLRDKVVDMYFFTKDGAPLMTAHLSPAFCARGLTLLVERVISTMEKDLHRAA